LQLANLGFGDNASKSTEEKLEKLNVSIDIIFRLAQALVSKLTPFAGPSRTNWHLISIPDQDFAIALLKFHEVSLGISVGWEVWELLKE
jgi:hypothetical protein